MADYISRALVADALTEWRSLLRSRSTVSALRDLVATGAATIELRGAHPAGLASLFAGRPTLLSTLFREQAQHRSAAVQAAQIAQQALDAYASTGSWTAAMVVGTAVWDGREVPVLLRPVALEHARDDDMLITLHPKVSLNPVLATELRERGGPSDLAARAELTLAGKEFDPRPIWQEIRDNSHLFGELEVKEGLLLGAFDDPEQRLLDDLDALDPVIGASDMVAAIAGDLNAKVILAEPLPRWALSDRDPFGERGIGDLDDATFRAVDMAATGRSLVVDTPPGADGIGYVAAVAADAAAMGKTTLVVGGSEAVLLEVQARLESLGAGDLALTCVGEGWHAQGRAGVLTSLTLDAPSVDEDHLRAVGDALIEARAEVSRRYEALHKPRRPWGASVFETVQAIVRLTASDPAPGTALRLGPSAVAAIAEHGVAHVAAALVEELHGEQALSQVDAQPQESHQTMRPWWHRVASDAAQGAALDEALAEVVRGLPGLRTDAQTAHAVSALDEATTLAQWRTHVALFQDVQDTLDIFTPAVFHRSLAEMVVATAPKGMESEIELDKRERKALARRAQEFLRPGRSTDDLHAQLVKAHLQARAWRDMCSAGGWPMVPDAVDSYVSRLARVDAAWHVIAPVLPQAAGLDAPEELPWGELVTALSELAQGIPGGLHRAPARPAGIDVRLEGFGELADSFVERGATAEQIRVDVEFAWWATAFDAMIQAEPSLIEAGVLGREVERYLSLDSAFSHYRVGPLMRAAGDQRRRAITAHPEDARDLFATLMEGAEISLRQLRQSFTDLMGALRPVTIALADQVPHVLPPRRCIDLVVVVGAESLSTAQLIPALGRASQVVVVADPWSASHSAVAELCALLPHVELRALPGLRDPHVSAIFSELGYGDHIPAVPGPGVEPRGLTVVQVDAVGVPREGKTYVESTRAEVTTVVHRVERVLHTIPRRSVAVVAGNDWHASRIALALSQSDAAAAAGVTVEVLGQAAGMSADEVIFTLGYGKTASGEVPPDLGGLTSATGSQALAQALAVGQELTTIVTALDSAELLTVEDLAAEAGLHDFAVAALRHLMDSSRHPAVPAERSAPGPEDWLLADVARLLRSRGYAVRLRYGIGVQSIPLVVGTPHDRGYRLAVVTDEPSESPRSSVRDRLRWQYRSLEALGWTVLPLWTLDMFMDPVGAAEKIMAALEDDAATIELAVAPEVAEEAGDDSESDAASDSDSESEADSDSQSASEPELEPEPEPEPEHEPEPAAEAETEAEAEPAKPAPVLPASGSMRPLIPTKAWEDEDAAWSDRSGRSRDDEIRGDRPPHW